MFNIILKELKNFFRNPTNVFFCTIFPILLIYILGTFLQNLDTADYEVGVINIHYFSQDNSLQTEAALTSFLDNLQNEGTIEYIKSDSLDTSLSLADNDEINGVVELFDNNIVLHTGIDATKNRTLELLMNSFNQTSAVYNSAAKYNPMSLADDLDNADKKFTSAKDLGVNRTMLDYYAVAMIVMALFMCNLVNGANTFFEENSDKTNLRLFISTTRKSTIYIGKILGNVITAVVQIIVTMIASVCLFDSHYCKDLKGNIVLCIMFLVAALALVSFGMLIGQIVKFPPISVIMPVAWIMLFSSGSFSKEIYIEGFSNRMPPYLIQQAAFDLTIFGRYESALMAILISFIVLVLFTISGVAIYCKRGGAAA